MIMVLIGKSMKGVSITVPDYREPVCVPDTL